MPTTYDLWAKYERIFILALSLSKRQGSCVSISLHEPYFLLHILAQFRNIIPTTIQVLEPHRRGIYNGRCCEYNRETRELDALNGETEKLHIERQCGNIQELAE